MTHAGHLVRSSVTPAPAALRFSASGGGLAVRLCVLFAGAEIGVAGHGHVTAREGLALVGRNARAARQRREEDDHEARDTEAQTR